MFVGSCLIKVGADCPTYANGTLPSLFGLQGVEGIPASDVISVLLLLPKNLKVQRLLDVQYHLP